MTRLPDVAAGAPSERAWSILSDLVAVDTRMAGWEGEREGATVLADAFETVGLREVGLEEFDIPGWWRGSSTLSVPGRGRSYEADHDLIALPGCPSGRVEGRLVDVGHGTEAEFADADLEGAVVLASSASPEDGRWRHRMEKYADAVEGGAVGFVFRNHVEGCLPPTGEVGYHERPGSIPAIGVSKEVGATLARYCRGSPFVAPEDTDGAATGPTTVLDVDCQNGPATSVNVEGILGPDRGPELLVTAHVDAHDIAAGANDNGAGCAVIATVADLLSEVDLDRRVRVIAFGAEEIGLQGAYHCADRLDETALHAVINVDGAGRSRDLGVRHNGFDAIERAFEDATAALDAPLSTSDAVSPHGDQWAFVERGVPAAMVHSVDRSQRGRGWGHTHADTLDKLDPRDLGAIAVQVAEGVLRLDADHEPRHRDPSAIRDELATGYERELRVGGRWHFE